MSRLITNVNGVGRVNMARLNADGSLDGAFAPTVNAPVGTVARQSDGRLLIGGNFSSVNGFPRTGFARLNANGSLDSGFDVQLTATTICGTAWAIAVRPDDRIVVGGRFSACNSILRVNLCQLSANGVVDPDFNPGVFSLAAFDVVVFELSALSDGRLLVGGTFDRVAGVDTYIVTRLLATGAVDFTFGTTTGAYAYQTIFEMAVQPDGNVLVAGDFANLNISRMLATDPTPVNADLQITASSAPEPYAASESLTYTLAIANVGSDVASSVTGSIVFPRSSPSHPARLPARGPATRARSASRGSRRGRRRPYRCLEPSPEG